LAIELLHCVSLKISIRVVPNAGCITAARAKQKDNNNENILFD
jgi:hypothetical protein